MFRRHSLLVLIILISLAAQSLAFVENGKAQNVNHLIEFRNHLGTSERVSRCFCGFTSFKCCRKTPKPVKVGLQEPFFKSDNISLTQRLVLRC